MIDVNAYLGHFAFRQLRHNTADGLLALMDKKGSPEPWSPAPRRSPIATRSPATRKFAARRKPIATG